MKYRITVFLMALLVGMIVFNAAESIEAGTAKTSNIVKLADIKPGLKCEVHTCFSGYELVEYDAEVIGRIKNGIGANLDMILVRLSGKDIEKSGVFNGMSGSPVYHGKKLLGSVSFAIGSFPRQIIAGVTPAEYVLDIQTPLPEMKGKTGVTMLSQLNSAVFSRFKINDSRLARLIPPAQEENDLAAFGENSSRLLVPLSFSGFNEKAVKHLKLFASGLGFRLMDGGFTSGGNVGISPAMFSAGALADKIPVSKPDVSIAGGMAIAIPLVRGDISIAASGTVTYIEGNKLFAFGHEFFNSGAVEYPVHLAKVLTVFGSDFNGFHIVEPGEEIGKLHEDRLTGVYGKLGERASMIPVEVQIRNSGVLMHKYNFESIQGALAPILLFTSGVNTIYRSFSLDKQLTIGVKFYIELEGSGMKPVSAQDIYTGGQAATNAALLPAIALFMLEYNDFEKVRIRRVKIAFDYQVNQKKAEIIKVRYNKDELAPGERLDLRIYLRTWRGNTVVKDASFRIPESFSEGRLRIIIGDSSYITSMENRSIGARPQLVNLEHIVRLINSYRGGDNIYIQFRRVSRGIYTQGRFLSDLPTTALEMFTAKDTDSDIIPLRSALLAEDKISTDYLITGHQIVSLKIKTKPDLEKKEKK